MQNRRKLHPEAKKCIFSETIYLSSSWGNPFIAIMTTALRPYQRIVAWKEADDLCAFTYEITKRFPEEERGCLVNQMRRAAASVPTNIAEGNSRRTVKDKRKFMTIALSSLDELHYQYHLAFRLKYIDQRIFDEANDRIQRVGYLLAKLRNSVVLYCESSSHSSNSSHSS